MDNHITKSDIVELLKHFGFSSVVKNVSVHNGRATVIFSKRQSAQEAVDTLDTRDLDGRPLTAEIVGSEIIVNRQGDSKNRKAGVGISRAHASSPVKSSSGRSGGSFKNTKLRDSRDGTGPSRRDRRR